MDGSVKRVGRKKAKDKLRKIAIDKRDITVPKKVIQKRQSFVNIMAEIIEVPAALIMKVDPPYIEVFRSAESSNNPYKVGDREHLAGLYCEEVMKTRGVKGGKKPRRG